MEVCARDEVAKLRRIRGVCRVPLPPSTASSATSPNGYYISRFIPLCNITDNHNRTCYEITTNYIHTHTQITEHIGSPMVVSFSNYVSRHNPFRAGLQPTERFERPTSCSYPGQIRAMHRTWKFCACVFATELNAALCCCHSVVILVGHLCARRSVRPKCERICAPA